MAEAYTYVNSTGTVIPDTADLRDEVAAEYKAAFGADLDTSPSTPQGVLITAEALARKNAAQNNADLANQINPNLAGGVFLDAIMALTGLARTPATRTTVTAQLAGNPGAIIPAFSLAATTSGDQFQLLSGVVLDSNGDGEGEFRAVEYGPIAVSAGELNTIVTAVLGWDTITNADAGVTGTSTQSDAAARALRRNTLALQGIAMPEAITSGLNALEGVRSIQFRENYTGSSVVIEGVTLVAHSVWACVDGGADQEIAQVLLDNKSAGAAWNGSTPVDVVDQYSGQTYAVLFDRPTPVPVLFDIDVRAGTFTSGDIITDVQNAVLAWAESNFTVGQDVSAFEVAYAIVSACPGIYVAEVLQTKASPILWSSNEIEIFINEIATTQRSSITVTVQT